MATGRDDFVIAFRSAILKKKDKQRFSLLTLLFLSIFILILSNFDLKIINHIKFGINEVIYRSSYLISIPENKIKEVISEIKSHIDLHESHQNELIKIENTEQIIALNNFLTAENKKLRELIDESINSEEIFARVLIDKESPFLKSIVLNKGSKDNVKIGMAIMDRNYLVGQIIEVNYSNSRALLLSDLNSKIPVIIEPNGINAILSGQGHNDFAGLEFLPKLKKIKEGDVVYTSGVDGIISQAIPIGKVIEKDEIFFVEFFVDFNQLKYVKVNK